MQRIIFIKLRCPELFLEETPCGSILVNDFSHKRPLSPRLLGGRLLEIKI